MIRGRTLSFPSGILFKSRATSSAQLSLENSEEGPGRRGNLDPSPGRKTARIDMPKSWYCLLIPGLLLAGCATLPAGPSVMVLPGTGKDFEQFKVDDELCREWAAEQTGTTTQQASSNAAVSGAAVGTVLGAASGAAIGAAYGNPAMGAAVGSGVGLLGGMSVGAGQAQAAQWSVQRRYDGAYMQCMYAKGNQIPMPRGFRRPTSTRQSSGPPPDIPPPPPPRPWG